jgi:hypothetical protein
VSLAIVFAVTSTWVACNGSKIYSEIGAALAAENVAAQNGTERLARAALVGAGNA